MLFDAFVELCESFHATDVVDGHLECAFGADDTEELPSACHGGVDEVSLE